MRAAVADLSPLVLLASGLSLAGLTAIAFLLMTAPSPLPLQTHDLTARERVAAVSPATTSLARPRPHRRVGAWEEYPVKGRDRKGRVAAFRVLVLPGDQHWQFASDRVVLDAQGQEIDIRSRVQSPAMQELLASGTHLICVGAASVEGPVYLEEQRAAQRARRLAEQVSSAVPDSLSLHTLSLGRFARQCEDCNPGSTAAQRRVVLIVVAAAHDGVELAAALRDALFDNPAFPFDLQAYSRFDLRRL